MRLCDRLRTSPGGGKLHLPAKGQSFCRNPPFLIGPGERASPRARIYIMMFKKKKETNPFYGTEAWKRCRAAALRRDGGLCVWCMRRGRVTVDAKGRRWPVLATVVHHIQHLEDRPDLALDLDNLVSLCDSCHDEAHPEKRKNANRNPVQSDLTAGMKIEKI